MPEAPDYALLARQAESLTEGLGWVSALSNVSALIMEALDDVSWAGFYIAVERDGERSLVLGPFQGKAACTSIAWGSGVCGTAAATDELQLVPDVHAFPGHIACDAGSRSELVIPVHAADGSVAAVLDLDSYSSARFTEAEAEGLSMLVAALERTLDLGGPAL